MHGMAWPRVRVGQSATSLGKMKLICVMDAQRHHCPLELFDAHHRNDHDD